MPSYRFLGEKRRVAKRQNVRRGDNTTNKGDQKCKARSSEALADKKVGATARKGQKERMQHI